MFDTGQAARVLQFKGFGLAYLLQSYCGVLADKKYQLAEWRQRPIPQEMVKYAREDTHYLLYIYDMLRKELIEKGLKLNSKNPFALFKQCLHKSNGICLNTWEKPILKDYNYFMIIQRNQASNSLTQTSVLKALIKWRDYAARVEDESNYYIMPNHVMF
jgi:exosome complex exonuclease RRP6